MKPITSGKGKNTYTLYFPFSVRDGVVSFDINRFINHLKNELPGDIKIESVENRGVNILKLSQFPSKLKATKLFYRLRKIFLYLAIENDISIYIHDYLCDIEKPFAHFPSSWKDGINAGWNSDEKSGLIKIDGIAHIVHPVIVPDNKKIVDSEILVGHIQSRFKYDRIPNAIACSKFDNTRLNSKKGELASKAYLNAFSHDNPLLKFISLITCLEILAERKKKGKAFARAVGSATKAINGIKTSNSDERKAIHSLSSFVGRQKNQSITEALEDLIDSAKDLIAEELPADHPDKNDIVNAVKDMYGLRSKIIHNASLGQDLNRFHRLIQIAHCSAKVLLKRELKFD